MVADLDTREVERLRKWLAVQEIRDVVLRYCRGIDRMNREVVRSCYHPDATDEHGSFGGNVDEFVEWVFRVVGRYSMSMHFIGNVLVDFADSADVPSDAHAPVLARAESYGISHHRTDGGADKDNLIIGFRYIDRFERRDDGPWRIASRVATTEWARVDDAAHQWAIPEGMRTGQRDGSDLVFAPLVFAG